MQQAISSYKKTTLLAAGVFLPFAATSLGLMWAGGAARVALGAFCAVLAVGALIVAVGGAVVLRRNQLAQTQGRDLFLRLNAGKLEEAIKHSDMLSPGRVRLALRRLLGCPALRVGDVVWVASADAIRRTLDDEGCLEGLPFMPEMEQFCGQQFRVLRVVDKIYDYGRSKSLRRLDSSVLLTSTKCDGAAHDRCQANCFIVWKHAWLELRTAKRPSPALAVSRRAPDAEAARHATVTGWCAPIRDGDQRVFRCQYTDLAAASAPIPRWDPRPDLRPILSGNITTPAFLVAMLTRAFNSAQGLRGGVGFPAMPRSELKSTPRIDSDLRPGEQVRVLHADAIADTIDEKGRNRGLWFDREMLRHSGERHTISLRINRIIDDATGRMLDMKTPSVTLVGVDATGEYLRFNPQLDPLFWRECWLERIPDPRPVPRPTS